MNTVNDVVKSEIERLQAESKRNSDILDNITKSLKQLRVDRINTISTLNTINGAILAYRNVIELEEKHKDEAKEANPE